MVGVAAAELAAQGYSGISITLQRTSRIGPNETYQCRTGVQKLEDVAAKTRHLPQEYIQGHNDVSDTFLHYVRPLLGTLPPFELLE